MPDQRWRNLVTLQVLQYLQSYHIQRISNHGTPKSKHTRSSDLYICIKTGVYNINQHAELIGCLSRSEAWLYNQLIIRPDVMGSGGRVYRNRSVHSTFFYASFQLLMTSGNKYLIIYKCLCIWTHRYIYIYATATYSCMSLCANTYISSTNCCLKTGK